MPYPHACIARWAELDEDAGPLEATIVHLKKEIGATQTECAELQRAWIRQQTELVTVQKNRTKVTEKGPPFFMNLWKA